ncbi:hypothetical protein K402DRAFT_141430 [Aulographum hederae CBS 113979]|uniref:Uncharacterized protein n=1 Tax=Aulographum hederae CBS 113979 TaxID=1176131 RepID=A0A6G1GU86_9PEZI|nr:hypothetical protein K402DRAFT_141430 [Aulographum hederae CBS 113979]
MTTRVHWSRGLHSESLEIEDSGRTRGWTLWRQRWSLPVVVRPRLSLHQVHRPHHNNPAMAPIPPPSTPREPANNYLLSLLQLTTTATTYCAIRPPPAAHLCLLPASRSPLRRVSRTTYLHPPCTISEPRCCNALYQDLPHWGAVSWPSLTTSTVQSLIVWRREASLG